MPRTPQSKLKESFGPQKNFCVGDSGKSVVFPSESIARYDFLRQGPAISSTIQRVWLAKGYGSFQSAWRTIQGIETVHMIRKGRVRWLAKEDARGQALFIAGLFGLAA